MVAEVTPLLTLDRLSEDEEQARLRLIGQLSRAQKINARQQSYYEGSKRARDLGISTPPHLRDLEAVAAWPEIVVDVVDERMDWRGWYTPDIDLGLTDVFRDNHLEIEVGQATLDSLIFGLSYLTVGTGDDDEPDVLVKAESPNRMTATWDPRKRRTTEALAELYDARGRVTGWKLYLPDVTITAMRSRGQVLVVDRDEHGLGRPPVSALINRPRASRVTGRSEITRAVRSITDSAMRTLLGMEIAREFYAAPQRYLMGADESMFVDEHGKPTGQWAAIIGRMLMAPRDQNGETPTPGTFDSASPQPFTEILKTYSQMVSAASGLPATHLGFNTDNPASEGAIAKADERLDKRALRRQSHYDLGLVDLGALAVLWRDGELPPPGAVRSRWTPVSMTSPGAAADRATKMIASQVLDPTWDFTLEQFGLTDEEIAQVQRERRRTGGSAALRAIAAAAESGQPVVTGANGA